MHLVSNVIRRLGNAEIGVFVQEVTRLVQELLHIFLSEMPPVVIEELLQFREGYFLRTFHALHLSKVPSKHCSGHHIRSQPRTLIQIPHSFPKPCIRNPSIALLHTSYRIRFPDKDSQLVITRSHSAQLQSVTQLRYFQQLRVHIAGQVEHFLDVLFHRVW